MLSHGIYSHRSGLGASTGVEPERLAEYPLGHANDSERIVVKLWWRRCANSPPPDTTEVDPQCVLILSPLTITARPASSAVKRKPPQALSTVAPFVVMGLWVSAKRAPLSTHASAIVARGSNLRNNEHELRVTPGHTASWRGWSRIIPSKASVIVPSTWGEACRLLLKRQRRLESKLILRYARGWVRNLLTKPAGVVLRSGVAGKCLKLNGPRYVRVLKEDGNDILIREAWQESTIVHRRVRGLVLQPVNAWRAFFLWIAN